MWPYRAGWRDLLQENLQWRWRGYWNGLPTSPPFVVLPHQGLTQQRLLKYRVRVELGIPFIILKYIKLLRWPHALPLLFYFSSVIFLPAPLVLSRNFKKGWLSTHSCLGYSASPIYPDYGMENILLFGLIKVPSHFFFQRKKLVEDFKKIKQRGTEIVSGHRFSL